MCLSKLEKFYPAKVGYSVRRVSYRNGEKEYQAVFRYHDVAEVDPSTKEVIQYSYHFEVGKTYRARRETVHLFPYVRKKGRLAYPSGFHVFHKLTDARKFATKHSTPYARVILKVKVFGRKTVGIQWKCRVTVAEFMTILEEVE